MAGCRLAWWAFTCPDTARARFASVTSDLKTTSRLDGFSPSSCHPHTHLQLNNLYQELLYLSPLATTPKQAPKTWPISLYSKREVLFYISAESYSKGIWRCIMSLLSLLPYIYMSGTLKTKLTPAMSLSSGKQHKTQILKVWLVSLYSIRSTFLCLNAHSKHTWTLSMSLLPLLVLKFI